METNTAEADKLNEAEVHKDAQPETVSPDIVGSDEAERDATEDDDIVSEIEDVPGAKTEELGLLPFEMERDGLLDADFESKLAVGKAPDGL